MSEIFSKILKDKNGKVLNVGSKYKQPEWGSEVAEVEILPQTSFNSDSEVSLSGHFVIKYPTSNRLEAGKEYVVEFNGKKYVLTAWEHHQTIPMNPPVEITATVLGNGMTAGVEGMETNVPFGIVQAENQENKDGQLKTFDGSTNATISIKAVEETIHKLPSKYVEGAAGGKYKQPEWGAETAIMDILPETELTILEDVGAALIMQEVPLTAGNVYTVNFNGTEYACTAYDSPDGGAIIGNASVVDDTFSVTDEPFLFMTIPEVGRENYMGACAIAMPLDGSTAFTLSIRGEVETVYEIPAKYIGTKKPLIVTTSDGERASAKSMEIEDAVNAGTLVYFADTSGNIIPLNRVSSSVAAFVITETNSATVTVTQYTINNNGYISEYTKQI